MSQASKFVESSRLYFRALQPSDAEGNYLQWMNDPEVTRYLESRYRPESAQSLKGFIEKMSASPDNVFCAVITKHDHRHIGNIKLGPIDWIHRRAEVGLLIGEKDCWGKGYGTEAYRMMCEHAFLTLNLHKVTAGAYAANEGSSKALVRAGFTPEGLRKNHCFFEGDYIDLAIFGFLREDFVHRELVEESLASAVATVASK